ncbi:hypothetical protein Fmac_008051 [Flemingia macrophylla]|uniref:Uncharacterized protein n=1 Tax=Flemingia macrophylla TaxID=520843 RepID=A0ABD1MWV5_9FABA
METFSFRLASQPLHPPQSPPHDQDSQQSNDNELDDYHDQSLQGKLKQANFVNFLVAIMEKSKLHVEKNEHPRWINMSLLPSSQHAVELKHENRHQGSFFKREALIKHSGKRMEDERSKTLCMCLPGFGFGKSKAVKARKGGIQMDHSVNHVMSSTFSLEDFEHSSGVTQGKGIIVQENDHDDDSISSYFDLPSIILKCNGDDA